MKIEADIVAIQQDYEIDTGVQTNFLILNVLGTQHRIPVAEDVVMKYVKAFRDAAQRQIDTQEPTEEQFGGDFAPAAPPAIVTAPVQPKTQQLDALRARARSPLVAQPPAAQAPDDDDEVEEDFEQG